MAEDVDSALTVHGAERPEAQHSPPFYEFMGLRIGADGDPSVSIDRRDALLNSHGSLHGGAVMSVLDAALSRAIRTHMGRPIRMATIDMTVHFVGPAAGGRIEAIGTVVKVGTTVAYARATAHTLDGDVVAIASGAFRIFKAKD